MHNLGLPLPPREKEEERKDLKIYLDPEEIERVISCCSSFRDKLIVRLLWRTGLRILELLSLRIEDIDFDNATLKVELLKQRGRERRIIPIDRESLRMLERYLFGRTQGKVFGIGVRRVQQIINQVGKVAGIEAVGDMNQGRAWKLHPHTFRHSFAIHWIKILGAERIVELQRHLGHRKLETTSRYLKFSPQALHDCYNKLW